MSAYTFTQRRIMVREFRRITFVFTSNGIDNAVEFCKQGVKQYNNSLKTGYGKSYDQELRGSIFVYLTFLKNGDYI